MSGEPETPAHLPHEDGAEPKGTLPAAGSFGGQHSAGVAAGAGNRSMDENKKDDSPA
ncbi:MAG: hypothetical protein ACRYG4_26635 [Janthinobacterium lividum]